MYSILPYAYEQSYCMLTQILVLSLPRRYWQYQWTIRNANYSQMALHQQNQKKIHFHK